MFSRCKFIPTATNIIYKLIGENNSLNLLPIIGRETFNYQFLTKIMYRVYLYTIN